MKLSGCIAERDKPASGWELAARPTKTNFSGAILPERVEIVPEKFVARGRAAILLRSRRSSSVTRVVGRKRLHDSAQPES